MQTGYEEMDEKTDVDGSDTDRCCSDDGLMVVAEQDDAIDIYPIRGWCQWERQAAERTAQDKHDSLYTLLNVADNRGSQSDEIEPMKAIPATSYVNRN